MLRHSERTEEMTEAARETSAGGTGDGSRCRKGYRRNGILLWGMVILFTLLYLSLIFNDNVWTDEIFSMNLFADSFAQIIVDTAEDVHPPLYYFLGRIMRLLFGESLQVQKILTIIPMSLTLALEATKKKIEWGAQIRSYVFDDRRVKDHRTGYQTSNVEAVMDGDIDPFIKAYLMEYGSEAR